MRSSAAGTGLLEADPDESWASSEQIYVGGVRCPSMRFENLYASNIVHALHLLVKQFDLCFLEWANEEVQRMWHSNSISQTDERLRFSRWVQNILTELWEFSAWHWKSVARAVLGKLLHTLGSHHIERFLQGLSLSLCIAKFLGPVSPSLLLLTSDDQS